MVCVATDAPKTERLTAVFSDPYTSCAMVAELFIRAVRDSGSVLLVTGDLNTHDHAEKVRGFESFLATGGNLTLGPVIQARDDPGEAYSRVYRQLTGSPGIRAIYVSTANSLPVIVPATTIAAISRAWMTSGFINPHKISSQPYITASRLTSG